jgi:hypothetical protein
MADFKITAGQAKKILGLGGIVKGLEKKISSLEKELRERPEPKGEKEEEEAEEKPKRKGFFERLNERLLANRKRKKEKESEE